MKEGGRKRAHHPLTRSLGRKKGQGGKGERRKKWGDL